MDQVSLDFYFACFVTIAGLWISVPLGFSKLRRLGHERLPEYLMNRLEQHSKLGPLFVVVGSLWIIQLLLVN